MSYSRIGKPLLFPFLVLLIGATLPGSLVPTASAQESFFPSVEQGKRMTSTYELVAGQDLTEQRFSLHLPVWIEEKAAAYIFVRGQRLKWDAPLYVPDRNLMVPSDFGGFDMGAGGGFETSHRMSYGFMANQAITGRKLFDERNVTNSNVTAFARHDLENGNAWIFLVNYSDNRTRWNKILLPGFAYVMTAERSTAVLGFPFLFFHWRPYPVFAQFSASPFHISAEVSYFLYGPFQAFTGLSWLPRSYQNLIPEPEEGERLIYDRKDWVLGLRFLLNRESHLTLGYAHGLGRRIIVGKSLTGKGNKILPLPDDDAFHLKVKMSF